MRILFDHGTPAPLISFLAGHTVMKAKSAGWDRLVNGELLSAAEEAGFEILITTDKRIKFQQNLARRKIAIIALGNAQSPVLRQYVERVVYAVEAATARSYIEVDVPFD
jgi:hypothetical protein